MAESLSPRFGLNRWSADSDNFSRAEFDAIMAAIEAKGAMYGVGAIGERPVASAANLGTFWHANGFSDEESLWYSTGSAWELVWRDRGVSGRAFRSNFENLTADVWTAIAFNLSASMYGGMALGPLEDPVPSKQGRLIVPVAGTYLIVGTVRIDITGTSQQSLMSMLTKNGVGSTAGTFQEVRSPCITGNFGIDSNTSQVVTTAHLAAGDAIGLSAMIPGTSASIRIGVEGCTLEVALLNG